MKSLLFVDNSTRCFCIFRLPVAKAFVKAGYKVYVMSPPPFGDYLSQLEKEGIVHLPYELKGRFSLWGDLSLFFFLLKMYKRLRPDYIIHYTIKPNIYGSVAAKISSIPSLAVVPGTGSVFKNKGFISWLVLGLYKVAFLFPRKIWVLNGDDYAAFIEKRLVRTDKIEILPGEGVDTDYFKPIKDYTKNTPFVFLYMGRMLREKGIEYIVKSARLLREKGLVHFEIHLLGLIDGFAKDIITQDEINRWEKEGLVKFLGSVTDVRPYIQSSDCVLLPSFYGEGVPRSLMEACSMERMVIATDNVGCRDVIIHQYNGFLCKSRNVEDLALAMEKALLLPEEEIKLLGTQGRKRMLAEFNDSIIINKYKKELED